VSPQAWGLAGVGLGARRPVVLTLALGGVVLVAVAAVSLVTGTPIPRITQDVAAIAHVHPLAGALSSVGILLWWTSASVWLLAAFVERSRARLDDYRFALSTGLLSAYLALDDLFQFHEDLAGRVFGVEDPVIFAALGVVVAYYLISFRAQIARSEAMLFALAMFFLAMSVAVDAGHIHWLGQRLGHWMYMLEDGPKWMGIACWCAYALRRCHESLAAPTRREI
jgi:hypothetical protein